MKTIILPGYSPRNKDWADETKSSINIQNVVVQNWPHWTGGTMSIPQEAKKVATNIGPGKSGNVIAKSVGTRVAMRVVADDTIKINKLILCGIPTKGDSESAKKNYSPLENIDPERVLIFQNTKDPFASYLDIKKFIGGINSKIRMVEKPRSDHNYPFFEDFEAFLSS